MVLGPIDAEALIKILGGIGSFLVVLFGVWKNWRSEEDRRRETDDKASDKAKADLRGDYERVKGQRDALEEKLRQQEDYDDIKRKLEALRISRDLILDDLIACRLEVKRGQQAQKAE